MKVQGGMIDWTTGTYFSDDVVLIKDGSVAEGEKSVCAASQSTQASFPDVDLDVGQSATDDSPSP